MTAVNIREVRRRLSDLVTAAEHGETVVITRRGKKVAQIAPLPKKQSESLPDLTEFRKTIRLRGKPMSRTVIEMRREERG